MSGIVNLLATFYLTYMHICLYLTKINLEDLELSTIILMISDILLLVG